MSSAAIRIPAQQERKATPGTFEVPRSFAENMGLMADCERALFIILCRIPQDPDSPASISDATWEKWTGLKPRMKDLAIKGLLKKGLEMRGRGKTARFYWNESAWVNYIRENEPGGKAKATEGQKRSVPAKPGMQVHPDCSLKGCQKLCDTQGCENVVSIETDLKFVQHVAQTAHNSQILKNRERKGEDWSESLSAVQNFFPASGSAFLKQLLSAVKRRVEDFTDSQLAQAIRAAHKKNQHSDGMFLSTVPDALVGVIEGRIGAAPKAEPVPRLTEPQLQAHIEKHTAELKKAGMDDLARRVRLLDLEDFVKLDDALNEIEDLVIARLAARAPLDVIRAAVEPKLKPYKGKMTAEQVETVRQRFIGEKLLTDAGLTRMSVSYL